jgi:GntR family transcriptional regulator
MLLRDLEGPIQVASPALTGAHRARHEQGDQKLGTHPKRPLHMSKISRRNVSDEVARWLTGAIQLGRFKPGERLPSVAQLAKELGVGQSTVREALRHQQALGLVHMHQGKGTFVATLSPIELGSYVTSFSSIIRERGMTPGARLLRGEVTVPDDEVRASLALDAGEEVNLLQRLRLADGEPLAIETSLTPCRAFPNLLDDRRLLDGSLYELLAERYGVVVAFARQTVGAALITKAQGRLLKVEPGQAALEMHTVAYLADSTPVEYARSVYRADRYQYRVTLRRRNGVSG